MYICMYVYMYVYRSSMSVFWKTENHPSTPLCRDVSSRGPGSHIVPVGHPIFPLHLVTSPPPTSRHTRPSWQMHHRRESSTSRPIPCGAVSLLFSPSLSFFLCCMCIGNAIATLYGENRNKLYLNVIKLPLSFLRRRRSREAKAVHLHLLR
ncbi:hypothetical protein GGS23DRAFT_281529 [Durotheca rogersii]|uniref:uncharacterized protein n=1 Tax=Durotheca rogersii TaxID=419775 RepID=UPI00221E64B8|nr:uncharacterized protein GGS23DRAFT_281529 [Durotheca rogersii]KAI5866660.1 hypothetical protein GGS23DRAFT_281529 [Durotheca rogersii]